MNILNESTSIVMVGSWNQQILTPKWLKDNEITNQEKIQVEVATNNPAFPIRFKLENVYLHVSQSKVMVYPIEETETSYNSAETVATQLLEILKHTPISGIGYNFHFKEDKPDQKIIDGFVFKDEERMGTLGGIVKERIVKRQLIIHDKLLNLTMLLDNTDALTVDFNWHFNLSSTTDAKNKIENTFFKTYEQTKEIVEKLFTE
jgi:hypothetical protein